MPSLRRGARTFAVVASIIGWGAVCLQLALSIRLGIANGGGVIGGVAAYLGYFTVLTNIIAAFALTAPLVAPQSRAGGFFARPSVISGVAASIAVVGIVYSLVLRKTWDPQGWQLVADRLLHDVMPLVFLVYWWLAVPGRSVRWTNIPTWAMYPLLYLVYALLRGAVTGWYPYPFIDVSTLGYGRTMVHSMVVLVGFCLVSLLLVAANGLKGRLPASTAAMSSGRPGA